MGKMDVHIGEILARNARMYPDDLALVERAPAVGKRSRITWKEFSDRADQFSNVLRAKGIEKGDKVVHFMNNSIDWLVAYFGIVRTGAWVVPLNFRFTAEDLKYCCDVAQPKAMVFDEEFVPRINAVKDQLTAREYICLGKEIPSYAEDFTKLVNAAPATRLATEIEFDDPCGLYFTSGTTGQPKPILLTHKNMASACITENAHHLQTRKDMFILIPPLYHTGAKMHWFGSFIVGGPAVILKGVSPEWVLDAVSEEGGTIVWLLVPWAQDILLKLDSGELKISELQARPVAAHAHRGAAGPASLIMHWRNTSPRWTMIRTSGSRNRPGRAVSISAWRTRTRSERSGCPASTGRPASWTSRATTCRRVSPGSLIVRGDGVMREYYNNPEATAKALRDGWLYTGDMTRFDEDGFIWIVDRKKDVIITGGENVFPVEIEDFLHTNPKVKDAAVIGLPDERLGEIVVAIVDCVPGKELTEAGGSQVLRAAAQVQEAQEVFSWTRCPGTRRAR